MFAKYCSRQFTAIWFQLFSAIEKKTLKKLIAIERQNMQKNRNDWFCSHCDVAAEEAAVRPLQSRPLQHKNAQKGEKIVTMDTGFVLIHFSQ